MNAKSHPYSTEVLLTVRFAGGSSGGFYIPVLCVELKKKGARIWCGEPDSGGAMRIHGLTAADVDRTASLIAGLAGGWAVERLAVTETAWTPLPGDDGSELPPDTRLREKLTKKLLLVLPTGARIVSNCFGTGFDEILGPRETREAVWKRAVTTGAAGRLFVLIPANGNPEQ